jgi:hypothetical protein
MIAFPPKPYPLAGYKPYLFLKKMAPEKIFQLE